MVRLPFVSRRLCDAQQVTIELQKRVIEDLRTQNAELKALFNKTSQFEIAAQGEQGVTLKLKAVTAPSNSRGGWRGRRAAAEEQTQPAPADSVAALERRVAEAKT